MGKTIGIDLGTTNSVVAVLEGGDPVVIANAEGSRITPSMVTFTENNERLVGQTAKRQAITNPENTIHAIKRLLGRKYDSKEIRELQQHLPYKIVEHKNGDAWVSVRGRSLSPAEVSAMVLQKMKQTAEDYLGEEVEDAVVTVPAYFDDAQRQATKDAGRIAGLNVLRIINEPTAAALAYGLDRKGERTIAVFDLGGGTFDISILELGDGVFEVKATNGDTHLGGEDFDHRIIQWLADEFQKTTGIDLRDDRMALQRLKEAAERAKHELSSTLETEINLPFITADATGPKHLNIRITRTQFEAMVEDLIDRLTGPCRVAMGDAGLGPSHIDEVILVGGMTRMPRVQDKVQEIFGKEPSKCVNPDEVVAIGAAIQGGVLKGDVMDVILLDVTPLSLGIETLGGLFTKIIEKNTTIPCKKSQIFSTASDDQTAVSVHVLQGEREMAEDNRSLGRFELFGIPPAPRGVAQIEVAFEIDVNGIVQVTARDLGTKKEASIRITATSGLEEDEIERMIKESVAYSEKDRKKRALVEARNSLDSLIYYTDKSLRDYGGVLAGPARSKIEQSIESAKRVLEVKSGDPETYRAAYKDLSKASYELTEAMYT